MFKKLLVSLMVVGLVIGFTGQGMACVGEACADAKSDVNPESVVSGQVASADNTILNGGFANGDFTVKGKAYATGKDTEKWVKVQDTEPSGTLWQKKHGNLRTPCYRNPCEKPFQWHPQPQENNEWEFVGFKYDTHWEKQVIKGEALAIGTTNPTMKSSVDVFTNGTQHNGGLSYSFVKTTSELDIKGNLSAEGDQGCLQTAYIEAFGSLGASVYGSSNVLGPNGSFAQAGGVGTTTVGFYGYESDESIYGPIFGLFPNKAEVDFNSNIQVDQSVLNLSYVSPDGTKAGNFAFVGGGSAELNLGRDGLFGQDNINLTGIQANGLVNQHSQATNGINAYAYGGSTASFSGAVGSIEPYRGWCGPDQIANVGGMAVVGGYNNVVTGNGSLTVTSFQFGYATTGDNGLTIVGNGSY
jgi:hypothetical protein